MPEVRLAAGPGRVLVFVYGVFAVAATGRSSVQLLLTPERAPLAYSLSLLAALVYVAATVLLLRDAWRAAVVACAVEAVGVLVVGVLSYAAPGLFPDRTVWSHFGQGYGFVPLVLPFVGLWWLRRTRPGRTQVPGGAG